MSESHEQVEPSLVAMGRMAGLLKAFATDHTVRKPRGLLLDGEAMYAEEHSALEPFTQLAHADGWMLSEFDWASWDEGRAIVADLARIGETDLLTIRKLITALVRNERFCDGALQAAYEKGVIEAILERIKQLRTVEGDG